MVFWQYFGGFFGVLLVFFPWFFFVFISMGFLVVFGGFSVVFRGFSMAFSWFSFPFMMENQISFIRSFEK